MQTNPTYQEVQALRLDEKVVTSCSDVDAELNVESENAIANSAVAARFDEEDVKIEKAKQDAIDFADAEFAKLKLYKGEPTECVFLPPELKDEGRAAAYGNGVYALARMHKGQGLSDGKVCYILKSTDGVNFEPVILETDTIGQSRFNILEFDPVSKMFYGGRDRLFRSADLETWELLPNFPKNNIRSLSFLDGEIFIGTEEEQSEGSTANLWHSTDGGETWEIYREGTFGHIAKNGDDVVIAECYSQWLGGPSGTVQVSHDGGKTWKTVTGFENIGSGAGGLVFFKGNFILHVSGDGGVRGGIYWSPDGEVWTKGSGETVSGTFYSFRAFSQSPDGRYLCFNPCDVDAGKANIISLTVDGKTWHPIANTSGYKHWKCVWGHNGIFASGKSPLYPTLVKNIEIDYKVSLISDVLMTAPVFTADNIDGIVKFLNDLAKPFKIS